MDSSTPRRHNRSSRTGPGESPKPHHCHRTSLEGVINPPADEVSPDERDKATGMFYSIISYIESSMTADLETPYNRARLVRLIHDYARSQESKWLLLQEFFRYTNIIVDDPVDFDDAATVEHLRSRLNSFADYLMDNLLLPLKASAKKTPQPSPAQSSQIPSRFSALGSIERVASLRRDCLIRDRHRCAISHNFDLQEAERRLDQYGEDFAQDDQGCLLTNQVPESFAELEVAHIIPHSFMTTTGNIVLDESKRTARELLNMFDHGIIYLIEDSNIDRPLNAITLRIDLHRQFGSFKVFFESLPLATHPPHTYQIDTTQRRPLRMSMFPITRQLHLSPERTIDPPSARLLALHCAICKILQLSGAGDYILVRVPTG
ncbi:hypothetical protein F66182_8525 [Fusarium sp. NRRL 66182]|nr:hypothetical protein F66182_8525 [Fusarium sp. NRRL 66182]